ncbi:MAG TPA: peptidyl-prolyl cis-trans isomerase [Candidatus Sulfotelmatobacter sp.]|nr:peptidyl-prolyl cis-trans isomerase [Candidatus Sulfotelmatobacter sp.]
MMVRVAWVCLVIGTLAWGQSTKSIQATRAQNAALSDDGAQPKPTGAPNVAPDAAVITINGLCDDPSKDKGTTSSCKVVFTRAQFEAFADLIQPNMPLERRRQLAGSYADMLILAAKAREMGLDQGARFDELLMLKRLSLLGELLKQTLQEKAAKVSDKDISDYYQQNISAYEEAQLQRVYIPLAQQLEPPKEKLTAAETEKRLEDSKAAMRKEAEELDVRAFAGEDFAKLQEEAYQFAKIKTALPPSRVETYHRRDLSPAQVIAMNLKTGEISPVINDANGYFIYKAGEKHVEPLDKVRTQISSALRAQRFQEYLKAAQESATPVLNDDYFRAIPTGEQEGMSAPGAPVTGKGPAE